jgi:gamma-glutamyl-gamma-aminobutyrate hydrolase PuuD
MMAAQCHPEELYTEHTVWARLFNAFVKACSEAVVQPLEIVQPLGVAS